MMITEVLAKCLFMFVVVAHAWCVQYGSSNPRFSPMECHCARNVFMRMFLICRYYLCLLSTLGAFRITSCFLCLSLCFKDALCDCKIILPTLTTLQEELTIPGNAQIRQKIWWKKSEQVSLLVWRPVHIHYWLNSSRCPCSNMSSCKIIG